MVSSSVSATITEFGCNYVNDVSLVSNRNYAHICIQEQKWLQDHLLMIT